MLCYSVWWVWCILNLNENIRWKEEELERAEVDKNRYKKVLTKKIADVFIFTYKQKLKC